MKAWKRYLLATGSSVFSSFLLAQPLLAHAGHEGGYILIAFVVTTSTLAVLNLSYFIPGSGHKWKYGLSALLTLGVLLAKVLFWQEGMALDEVSFFRVVPLVVNACFGLYYFVQTQSRLPAQEREPA